MAVQVNHYFCVVGECLPTPKHVLFSSLQALRYLFSISVTITSFYSKHSSHITKMCIKPETTAQLPTSRALSIHNPTSNCPPQLRKLQQNCFLGQCSFVLAYHHDLMETWWSFRCVDHCAHAHANYDYMYLHTSPKLR